MVVSGSQTGKNQCLGNVTEILKGYTCNALDERFSIGIYRQYHHVGCDESAGKVEHNILI